MSEDLLHFVWKYKKFSLQDLSTSDGEQLFIKNVGTHNRLAGPDFFNAQIQIGKQLWAGNVEIHINASDWYAHHHEQDTNYNNVILHVVWENDVLVFREDHTCIPTLVLKDSLDADLLSAYQNLFNSNSNSFINCERQLPAYDSFHLKHWLERLYFERLEYKSMLILELCHQYKNDWESVTFTLLMKSFGSKINGESFFDIAQNIDFSVIRKIKDNITYLESTLFGMAGFLNDETCLDTYYLNLKATYQFLKNKHRLPQMGVQQPHFFKLRPANFPTLRLSQLAALYHSQQNLFNRIIKAECLEELYQIFEVTASAYWECHFTFGKIAKKSAKRLSKKFIDLIIINTVLPLKFCYAKYKGHSTPGVFLEIIMAIQKENNSVVNSFEMHGVRTKNAMDSQALLQLYNTYCARNKCLQCAIGGRLLNRKAQV